MIDMQRVINSDQPAFIVQHEDDAALLRQWGASVWILEEAIGLPAAEVILIVRGNGLETLKGMNLAFSGRVVDLGVNGNLDAYVTGHADPIALLRNEARDLYAHEEAPVSVCKVDPLKPGVPCGIPFLHSHLRWRPGGELVVIAGPYGSGKSSFARLLAYTWADHAGRSENAHASLACWEDDLAVIKREIARYALEGDVTGAMSSAQVRRLLDMENRVHWTQRDADLLRDFDWYCKLIEHRARCDNVRFFVADPWNAFDSSRDVREIETQYVDKIMLRLQRMVEKLGITIVMVTHLSAKSYDDEGKVRPFRIANAFGSVNFGNKMHRGICVSRSRYLAESSDTGRDDHLILHFDKARNEEQMGIRGTVVCVYDPKTMGLTYDNGATAEVRKLWR